MHIVFKLINHYKGINLAFIIYIFLHINAFASPTNKNPSWLKETYLIDIENTQTNELLYSVFPGEKIKLSCQVLTPDNRVLMNYVCKRNYDTYFLNFDRTNIQNLNKYFVQNPPLDKFLLPTLQLKVKEGNQQYKTRIYFYSKNYKPIILTGGLIADPTTNSKDCVFAVKDRQNLYLTGEFYINNNSRTSKIFSVFSNNKQKFLDLIPKDFKNKHIQIFYAKVTNLQHFCKLIISNGLTISSGINNTLISKEEFIHNLEVSTQSIE